MHCVGMVEIDKNCQKVLAAQWPDVPLHDDVRTACEWADRLGLPGSVDLVCGGFPCQDVSKAGRRAGLAGERTGLFFDALAFATHVEARWFVLENVPGLLTSNSGRDFGTIILALGDSGFRYQEWRIVDSQYFGVPQRRRRLFLIAGTTGPRRRPLLAEPESGPGNSDASEPSRAPLAGTTTRCAHSVEPTVTSHLDRSCECANGAPMNVGIAATLNSGGAEGGFRTEPGEHLVVARYRR